MFQISGYDAEKSVELLDSLANSISYNNYVRLLKAKELVNYYFVKDENPFDLAREKLKQEIDSLNELESILKPCLRRKLNNNQ